VRCPSAARLLILGTAAAAVSTWRSLGVSFVPSSPAQRLGASANAAKAGIAAQDGSLAAAIGSLEARGARVTLEAAKKAAAAGGKIIESGETIYLKVHTGRYIGEIDGTTKKEGVKAPCYQWWACVHATCQRTMSFRELRNFCEIMRSLGYHRIISMENFRQPNFELTADILDWLLHRFEPGAGVPDDISTETHRVEFIKAVCEKVVLRTGTKLNARKLYGADGYAVKELLRLATVLYDAQKSVNEKSELVRAVQKHLLQNGCTKCTVD